MGVFNIEKGWKYLEYRLCIFSLQKTPSCPPQAVGGSLATPGCQGGARSRDRAAVLGRWPEMSIISWWKSTPPKLGYFLRKSPDVVEFLLLHRNVCLRLFCILGVLLSHRWDDLINLDWSPFPFLHHTVAEWPSWSKAVTIEATSRLETWRFL